MNERTMMLGRHGVAAAAFAAALLFAPTDVSAQANQSQSLSSAIPGLSQNRDKPVTIRAAKLEVRDKDKVATFSGDVHVIQGDMNLRCKMLVVYYEGDVGKSAAPAQPDSGQQQIKRMLAKGSVVVTQKDQVATGDTGDFDMRANKGTLTGNVVLTRGTNVIRGGQRLVVNLSTGVYTVEGGRLEMLVDSKAGGADAKQGLPQPQPQPLQPPPRQGRRN